MFFIKNEIRARGSCSFVMLWRANGRTDERKPREINIERFLSVQFTGIGSPEKHKAFEPELPCRLAEKRAERFPRTSRSFVFFSLEFLYIPTLLCFQRTRVAFRARTCTKKIFSSRPGARRRRRTEIPGKHG